MDLTESELIKDSMILEYQNALAQAQYQVAMLNGQGKLKDHRISQLEEILGNTEKEPHVNV